MIIAVPGRSGAGEAAVHEGAAGIPAVRSLQDVHREDSGEKDQKRWVVGAAAAGGATRMQPSAVRTSWGMLGWLLRVTPFLLPRGCGICASEHPAERASAQGKAPAALSVCGETEAHGTAGFSLWELGWLRVWVEGDSRVVLQGTSFLLKWSPEWQEAACSHPLPVLPAQAGPPLAPLCLLSPRTWGPQWWAQPCLMHPLLSPRLVNAVTPSPPLMCPSSRRSSWTKTRVRAWGLLVLRHLAWGWLQQAIAGGTVADAGCHIQAGKAPW